MIIEDYITLTILLQILVVFSYIGSLLVDDYIGKKLFKIIGFLTLIVTPWVLIFNYIMG